MSDFVVQYRKTKMDPYFDKNKSMENLPPAYRADMPLGAYVMECKNFFQEEGRAGESQKLYEARIYAKAKAGKTLTPEEMNFLRRTNPVFYQYVLRAQLMKKALEQRLKSANSKEEAQTIYSSAMVSVSEKDPAREMILAAYGEAWKEFRDSDAYHRLPETDEEAQRGHRLAGKCMFERNESGYQEVYWEEEPQFSFMANG